MDNNYNRKDEEIFGVKVRAGRKRTYFFDVKPTRQGDYYICITESKRRFDDSGYDRHKIYVYKEDFNKFQAGLDETINYVKTELLPDFDFDMFTRDRDDNEKVTTTIGSESPSDSTVDPMSIYDETALNPEENDDPTAEGKSGDTDGPEIEPGETW